MSVQVEPNAERLALRIQELEQENLRLSRELEDRRHSEGLYRTLAENLPIGAAFLLDRDLRYVLVEGQALEGAGLSSRKLVGRTIREALDQETADQYEPLYRKVLDGETFVFEYPSNNRDYLSRGIPITNDQGQVVSVLVLSYDITERKRLEGALRESEYRFRTMANGTPVMIWVTNADGDPEFINQAYTDFFGISLEQVQNIGWKMLVHPDDEMMYVEEYQFCLSQRRPFRAQARVYRQDGQWRWIESYGALRFSENGDFLGTIGSSHDITERVEGENALRESEVKFHSAFEHAAIGFAMTTPNGNYVDVNAAYCSLTGYSHEELLEHHYFELVHPDDVEENLQFAGQLLAGEISSYTIENRYTRKDGQAIWVRKSISTIYGPNGNPKWLLALVEDINEQKLAEQAFRKSEKIYRAIGESIPYGIWICDPDGRNIYASQSYLDLVGITQEQCSEFGWGDTLHPDDAQRTIEAWKECVRTEGTWDIEHRFLGKDGQYHPILARGVPVRNEQGEIVCWAGINLDVSRFEKAEQDLKTSEEHFRVALKNFPMIVYTTDSELRYTWIYNPAFGFNAAQLIGKTDEEVNAPQDVKDLTALKRAVLDTGIGRREDVALRYQGMNYYYDATVEPICNENGAVVGLTVAAIDITEKKRTELQQ
ncbi:MAG: PAS domain S-box protein [Bacteroidota bacterium]